MAADDRQLETVIAAPPQACFDELTSYEALTEWQGALQACEVVERDGEGRGSIVDYEISTPIRSLNYRLRHSYEEPMAIRGELVEGDVRGFRGEWSFEPVGDGTRATFSLSIDPGFWVPGKVKQLLHDTVMKRTLEDLRKRVESRAGSAGSTP
jgi:ribosome-associated toxin RatA of RatAB toxin-antitoxin module